jgi:Trypsin-co-occurring domain 2
VRQSGGVEAYAERLKAIEQQKPQFDSGSYGTWRSLVSAPALGAGGRRFKSGRPDQCRLPVGAGMIELTEVIGELRRELQEAINAGEGEQLRFELGPVELEATVAVEKGGGGGVKVRFWVLELGGDAKASEVSTHRVKLSLQPRLAGGGRVWVASDEAPGER